MAARIVILVLLFAKCWFRQTYSIMDQGALFKTKNADRFRRHFRNIKQVRVSRMKSVDMMCQHHKEDLHQILIFMATALKSDICFLKKRSTGSLSSTPRFSNSYSPSSSSSVFASSTSSFSRSTFFFHHASSPTCVDLSAPSVRFSLDSSVSPNHSIAVSSQWRPDRPTHTTTSAPPSNRALVVFFIFSHRGRR
ncbi:hypothetical protein Fmac_025015 [Flemingia macrophylla]|uniref:Secreted protein n=1 Tax=Flemingia macrophylla TaxID=520843 RepID=A0ABD1LR18_9FABA